MTGKPEVKLIRKDKKDEDLMKLGGKKKGLLPDSSTEKKFHAVCSGS